MATNSVGATSGAERIADGGGMKRRVAIIAALVIALLLVGVGSDFLAIQLSPPSAQVLVANYDTSTQSFDKGLLQSHLSVPAQSDGACNCASSHATASGAPTSTACALPPTDTTGQVVLVCISRQQVYAYQDGSQVYTAMVYTGRTAAPTPTGTFSIFFKATNIVFTSPWPKGSGLWYYPTPIHYAMEFKQGGYFLHDAWWIEYFGPGANGPHRNADGTWQNGSYGCVGMSVPDAAWFYNWTNIGTTVVIM